MKRSFDLAKMSMPDLVFLDKEYRETFEKYAKAGYEMPNNFLGVIRDMYCQQANKEERRASNMNLERYGYDFKNYSTSLGALRIDALKRLTEIKLLNACMASFENKEPVTFRFEGAIPDEETREFLNLSDCAENYLNITRTDALRLPKGFFGSIPKESTFTIYPEGESVQITQSDNKVEEVVNTMPFGSAFMKDEEMEF